MANLSIEIDRLAALSRSRAVWVRVGQLIDGVSDRPLLDANVVFDANEIKWVGFAVPVNILPTNKIEPDAILNDVTVLPMLIEAHAHAFLEGAPVNFRGASNT